MKKKHSAVSGEGDKSFPNYFFASCIRFMALAMLFGYSIAAVAQQDTEIGSRLVHLELVTEDTPAPEFNLPDNKKINHRLSDYKGRVVVVNFWSTWCIPCRKEMPALERTWQRIKPSGGVVLGIAMQDELAAIQYFLGKMPVSFPILMDQDGEVAKQWGVVGIPTTFILDTAGRTVYRASGIREWDSDSVISRIMELTKPR